MSKITVPRKAIATLTAIAAGALTLAACSTATPGDGASGGSTTLTVGTNGGTAMKGVISAFEDANPGVKVVVKDSPENYQQVAATQLTGGTAPDVIQIWPGVGNNMSIDVLGGKDQLTDLTGASWAESLPDSALTLLSKDDKLLAVPMTFSSIGGIYNQKELERGSRLLLGCRWRRQGRLRPRPVRHVDHPADPLRAHGEPGLRTGPRLRGEAAGWQRHVL